MTWKALYQRRLSISGENRENFLSILSIKCRNWFYGADRAERADRAESKEFPVFMRVWAYVVENQ